MHGAIAAENGATLALRKLLKRPKIATVTLTLGKILLAAGSRVFRRNCKFQAIQRRNFPLQ